MIRQVNSKQSIIDSWTFGGGTAMMLQIDHRKSHDIDIFLSDPQQLPFLDPQKRDFQFEPQPGILEGDGARSLVFEKIGSIDFIVGPPLTASPITRVDVEGDTVLLETIPEIITKKVYYRGSLIKPRDIFDIVAAGEQHATSLINELRNYRDEVARALARMDKLNAEFVNRTIAQLAIKDQYKAIAKTAFERSREILRAV